MAIHEVFKNPLVKQVIFQIRFPNLFYIEDKIGEFQISIMDRFPKASLLFERQFVFGLGNELDLNKDNKDKIEQAGNKVWKFENDDDVLVNVYSDSLSITSKSHKTYNNSPKQEERFRDTIEFVIGNFIKIVRIPTILRIGFRYMDEYDLNEFNNHILGNHINSGFNLERFNVENSLGMNLQVQAKVENKFFNYGEKIEKRDYLWKIYLDFDAYTTNIKAENYLEVTDQLHELNSNEFEIVVKEPVYKYMRGE